MLPPGPLKRVKSENGFILYYYLVIYIEQGFRLKEYDLEKNISLT